MELLSIQSWWHFIYHSQCTFFCLIMASLLCYVLLRFAYFINFDKVNSILDETILKIMITTTMVIGIGCDAYELGMKVGETTNNI